MPRLYAHRMAADPFDEAIGLLRRKRAGAVALVEKYDHAIEVMIELQGEAQRVTAEPAPAVNGKFGTGKTAAMTRSARRPVDPRSVKSRVRALMERYPIAEASPGQIIDQFEREGDPIKAANVGNAV